MGSCFRDEESINSNVWVFDSYKEVCEPHDNSG